MPGLPWYRIYSYEETLCGGYSRRYRQRTVYPYAGTGYDVKAGTQTDTKIRLRGKGVPSWRNKDVRGDHYVTLVVQTPDKLKPEAKELLKQFDVLTGDSLNAVKKATESGEGESKENDSRDGKKKKFWK